jgi:hypothetical protein
MGGTSARRGEEAEKIAGSLKEEFLPAFDIDLGSGQDKRLCFTFRIDPERICTMMKRANLCGNEKTGEIFP